MAKTAWSSWSTSGLESAERCCNSGRGMASIAWWMMAGFSDSRTIDWSNLQNKWRVKRGRVSLIYHRQLGPVSKMCTWWCAICLLSLFLLQSEQWWRRHHLPHQMMYNTVWCTRSCWPCSRHTSTCMRPGREVRNLKPFWLILGRTKGDTWPLQHLLLVVGNCPLIFIWALIITCMMMCIQVPDIVEWH